jgi:hypothetical protein
MVVLLCVMASCAEPPAGVVTQDQGMRPLAGGVMEALSSESCPELQCVDLGGAYISHYTEPNCTGVEHYYTAYFGRDGVSRSWDGQGFAGTTR